MTRDEIAQLIADEPFWLDKTGVHKCVNRFVPRTIHSVALDLTSKGVAQHITKKKLGKYTIYDRSEVADYIYALLEVVAEPIDGQREDMVARTMKRKAMQKAEGQKAGADT